MAASLPQAEVDLTCPICCDIFTDPVLLLCSHSFCQACVQEYWRQRGFKECPVCRQTSQLSDPPRNLALKNLCEAYLQQRRQRALTMQEKKQKLQTKHTLLKKKLKVFNEVKLTCNETEKHIKIQVQSTEKQIKEEFKKLHQFLQVEETARITALREEERQKSQFMNRKMESMSRDISSLSETIRTIETQMKAEEMKFGKNFKHIMRRADVLCRQSDPERAVGSLIDVPKHIGNLAFRVMEKMRKSVQYTPVILNPNTAHPYLLLSEDLTSVRGGERTQQLPANPERLQEYSWVLGSEGFSSGTHSWEIEVGESYYWYIGVAPEFVRDPHTWNEVWGMCYTCGAYYEGSPNNNQSIFTYIRHGVKGQDEVHKIRVFLDCNRGKMTFHNLDNNTQMHTITIKFTGKLFPAVMVYDCLKILPMKTS